MHHVFNSFGVALHFYLQDWSTTVQVNVCAMNSDSDIFLTLSMTIL